MESLAIHLALHGVLVLLVSLVGGLFLYRANLTKRGVHGWHLLHAGGSGRGIMLIAVAAIIHLPALPLGVLMMSGWLMIFFVWTSMLAMLLVAVSGEHGFGWSGSGTNKIIFALYVAGTVAVFPACLILIYGLLNALRV